MAVTIPFTKAVSLAEFEKHAQDCFAPRCKVFIRKDRVVIAQSASKGAVILPKETPTGMNVVVAPQLPTALGFFIEKMQFPIALVLGALPGGIIAGAIGGLIGGNVIFVLLLLRNLPSVGIAKEVENAVRKMGGAEAMPVEQKVAEKAAQRVRVEKTCPNCGAKYRPDDYNPAAPQWSCSSCKTLLPRT